MEKDESDIIDVADPEVQVSEMTKKISIPKKKKNSNQSLAENSPETADEISEDITENDIFNRFRSVFGDFTPEEFTLNRLVEKVSEVIDKNEIEKLIEIEELLDAYKKLVQFQYQKVLDIKPEGKVSFETVKPISGKKRYSYLKAYWKSEGQRKAEIIKPKDPPELVVGKSDEPNPAESKSKSEITADKKIKPADLIKRQRV